MSFEASSRWQQQFVLMDINLLPTARNLNIPKYFLHWNSCPHKRREKKTSVPKKTPKRAQLIRINKTSLTWSWILAFFVSVFLILYGHLFTGFLSFRCFIRETFFLWFYDSMLASYFLITAHTHNLIKQNFTHFSKEASDLIASS